MSDPIIGIDLGTSNSVVAWENEVGKVSVLASADGTRIHPSVVSFVGDENVVGGVVVGAQAKLRKVIDPENTIYSFKRLMGQGSGSLAVRQAKSRVPFAIYDGPNQQPMIATRVGGMSPIELSAILLDYLRDIASAQIGRTVKHAVVTVPANFNDAQRSATASAGKIAGLEIVRVLNEPTAAALAYGATKRLHEIIAVYDFGGGTFDLTIMKLEDQVYSVLGTAGDSFLGGDDLDERLVDRMLAKIVADRKVDLRPNMIAMMQLRGIAEQLKVELSSRARAPVHLGNLGGEEINLSMELSADQFVSMISDLVERTFSVTRDALAIAGVKKDRIADVILVGGTTQIPFIRNSVAGFFEKAARTDVSPEDAVAIGAAVQAASLEQLLGRRSFSGPAVTAEGASAPTSVGMPLNIPEPTAMTVDEPAADTGYLLEDRPFAFGPTPEPARPANTILDDILFRPPTENEWVLTEEDIEVDVEFEGTPAPGAASQRAASQPAAAFVGAPASPLAQVSAAAAYAAPVRPTPRPTVIDVTPTSFGIATVGGFCEVLIRRNARLPIEVKKQFTTSRDNQDSVRIVVCQGETRRLDTNLVLGTVYLQELVAKPRGLVSIEVGFKLDTSGMLQVVAYDISTGQMQRVSLDLVGRMDEQEVAAAQARIQQLRR